MIDRLLTLSVRHKHLVFLFTAAACAWGVWSILRMPVDAMPDLGDTQVIIYSKWDRSPDIIEDQVTRPIVTTLRGAPRVRTVRGISDFGYSYVYMIFEDGTDPYWARSRTLEYLSSVIAQLPEGVKTELGPDASGLGWVYQYVLLDDSGTHSLAELRSYQDWYLKPYLSSVAGVSEVATVGGFVTQYQVNVDPNRLQALKIPLSAVTAAVRSANKQTGARLMELGGAEYMIRGQGYLRSAKDLEEVVLENVNGVPVRIADVASVTMGPELRRGSAEYDGHGEAVSGIIIMREGANALDVIGRVKDRIASLQHEMPTGVRVVPVYDRSTLIHSAISNSRATLFGVILTVSIIILVFLWHFPSSVIPLITIPVTVLLTFIPLSLCGVSINILTLAGIALACGEFVDAAIIVVEQSYKKLEAAEGKHLDRRAVVFEAIREVTGPTFFTLLVIAVSFFPLLVLDGETGKLFRPLVLAKSFGLLCAALLALTLDPALRILLVRSGNDSSGSRLHHAMNWLLGGPIRREDRHPITGPLIRMYEPIVRWVTGHRFIVIGSACLLLALTIPAAMHLKSELMPTVEEGSLLYMPSTAPGISLTESRHLLELTDRILKTFPEVDHVLGKSGRADTATDPAPLSMLETVIILNPRSEWPRTSTWYSDWAPEWLASLCRHITPDHISDEELVAQMNAALKIPGLSNSWTMPIRGRIEMLSTGIRSPIGLKVQGPDLQKIQQLGTDISTAIAAMPETRSVYAERTADGYFLDIEWNRVALAQYGLSIETAQDALSSAVGGENVTTLLKGREKYPINVRYLRDFRSNLDVIREVLIPVSGDVQVPLYKLADVRLTNGPSMIRDEDGIPTGYVIIDTVGSNTADYVRAAQKQLAGVALPPGYMVSWSGQYEAIEHAKKKLELAVPVTIVVILILLYLNTRSLIKTLIITLAVPFSTIGAIWFLYLLNYNMSIAVWVGIVALLGIDAETGVFMLLYLELAYKKALRARAAMSAVELTNAIVEGAARRLRPKLMTFAVITIGLAPIMWSNGTGSAIMKRIAAPMLGGVITSFLLELLVYPAIYSLWRMRSVTPEPQSDC